MPFAMQQICYAYNTITNTYKNITYNYNYIVQPFWRSSLSKILFSPYLSKICKKKLIIAMSWGNQILKLFICYSDAPRS